MTGPFLLWHVVKLLTLWHEGRVVWERRGHFHVCVLPCGTVQKHPQPTLRESFLACMNQQRELTILNDKVAFNKFGEVEFNRRVSFLCMGPHRVVTQVPYVASACQTRTEVHIGSSTDVANAPWTPSKVLYLLNTLLQGKAFACVLAPSRELRLLCCSAVCLGEVRDGCLCTRCCWV